MYWECVVINAQDTLIFGDRRLPSGQCRSHWPRIARGCCDCIGHSTVCGRRPLCPLEDFLALTRRIRHLSNSGCVHLQIPSLLRDQLPVDLGFGRAAFLCF